MKHIFCLSFSIFFAAGVLFAQSYQLEARVEGAEGGNVYVKTKTAGLPTGAASKTDTAVLKDGQFRLSLKLRHPSLCILSFEKSPVEYAFWLDAGATNIMCNTASPTLIKVKGGVNQEVYQRFNEATGMFQMSEKKLIAIAAEAERTKDTQLLKEVRTEYMAMGKQLDQSYVAIIKQYPNTLATVDFILQNGFNKDLQTVSFWYGLLDYRLVGNPLYNDLEKLIVTKTFTTVNGVLPDISVADINGVTQTVRGLASKAKYTLVDLWASWCKPCVEEMPFIVSLYDKYKQSGFEVIGISIDEKEEKWKAAVEKINAGWKQLATLDGPLTLKLMDLYNFKVIPANFLIDSNGKIVAKNLHGKALEEELAKRLGK